MKQDEKIIIRTLKDGNWYWIDKTILQIYGRRLKPSAIAVYNVFASFSNSETQACFPTQKTIARLLGISRKTVTRKVRLLEELGLVKVEKREGRCFYSLLKPKVEGTNEQQPCSKRDISDETQGNINNKYIRNNNKNIDSYNFSDSNLKSKTREELLALDIAKEFNDIKALPLYLSYAKKYPESLLRKVLSDVKEIPSGKIKKSRGALFNHLIKQYAQKATKNNRN